VPHRHQSYGPPFYRHVKQPNFNAPTIASSSSVEPLIAMFGLQFTATRTQIASYLFGVALFSISFLVFLNSSISFVITQRIGQSRNVGDAVGTLGFVDELVALVACPAWGLLSDRVGVRSVAVVGYTIVGVSLWILVQAKNVYPALLLARILFSLGGSAT
jgi:MFS family permease